MERGTTMLMHAAVIGVVLYVTMVYALKQEASVAENRSIVIAAAVLIYMVLYGHGMPTKMNENI
jgi:uncharacterized membrane-anchored protein